MFNILERKNSTVTVWRLNIYPFYLLDTRKAVSARSAWRAVLAELREIVHSGGKWWSVPQLTHCWQPEGRENTLAYSGRASQGVDRACLYKPKRARDRIGSVHWRRVSTYWISAWNRSMMKPALKMASTEHPSCMFSRLAEIPLLQTLSMAGELEPTWHLPVSSLPSQYLTMKIQPEATEFTALVPKGG